VRTWIVYKLDMGTLEGRGMKAKRVPTGLLITKMVQIIVARFRPEKIILFGSHARGDAGPDSDVDLLIIMPVVGSRHEKRVEIRRALHAIGIPKDILVSTPEEYGRRKYVPGTIEWPAEREGRVLYAR